MVEGTPADDINERGNHRQGQIIPVYHNHSCPLEYMRPVYYLPQPSTHNSQVWTPPLQSISRQCVLALISDGQKQRRMNRKRVLLYLAGRVWGDWIEGPYTSGWVGDRGWGGRHMYLNSNKPPTQPVRQYAPYRWLRPHTRMKRAWVECSNLCSIYSM